MMSLEGVHVLLTGAASPTGVAALAELARRGADLVAVDEHEEAVESAMAGLDLADPDAVATRGLGDPSVGSWWDLANFIGAYFHTLDLWVHVAAKGGGEDAAAFAAGVERLREPLVECAREGDAPARIIVVAPPGDALADEVQRRAAELEGAVCCELLPAEASSDSMEALMARLVRAEGGAA